jgi:hypothetical protein
VRGGEHEVLLDGQQQLPPGAAARLGADLERADVRGGPAAGVLREFLFAGGQALPDEAAALQPDPDVDELTGKVLARYLKWLATSRRAGSRKWTSSTLPTARPSIAALTCDYS